jgi:hypothetical protein
MSSMLGYTAAREVLAATQQSVPPLVGMQGNRVATVPLMECVTRTSELADRIAAKDFDTALMMRGDSYTEMISVFRSISYALPSHRSKDRSYRIALINVGGLAPGNERRRSGRRAAWAGSWPHHARSPRQLPRPDRRGRAGRRPTISPSHPGR